MLEVTQAIHGGAGVLYIYGNYGGDVMNFDLAAEYAKDEGIEVRTVLGADDVASAPPERAAKRRGIAGIFFLYKVAGARAAEGASLDEVEAVTRAGRGRPAHDGRGALVLHPAGGRQAHLRPAGGRDGDRHGHPRRAGRPPRPAGDRRPDRRGAGRARSSRTCRTSPGDEVAVLVNGLGATPKEELYLLYRRTHQLLADAGITVHRAVVGEYATSLEMAGASISLLRLDDELKRLVDAPADSPFIVQV